MRKTFGVVITTILIAQIPLLLTFYIHFDRSPFYGIVLLVDVFTLGFDLGERFERWTRRLKKRIEAEEEGEK